MYVFSSFEYSAYLELGISDLEKRGIAREKILAVPLDKRVEERKLLDTIHRADGGVSLFDGAMVSGAIFMELGVIYGFIWKLGPVLWGLIGLVFGAALGLLLDYFWSSIRGKKQLLTRNKNKESERAAEVVLVVQCEPHEYQMVEKVLWDNLALGVGKLARLRQ